MMPWRQESIRRILVSTKCLADSWEYRDGREKGLSDPFHANNPAMHYLLPHNFNFTVCKIHMYKMHVVMNGVRLDFSATLSQAATHSKVPVSHLRTFRLHVKSTPQIGYNRCNSRLTKQIVVQSAQNQSEPRDQPSAANTSVTTILGRFTLPVVLSLVRNLIDSNARCVIHCLFAFELVRVFKRAGLLSFCPLISICIL